MILRPARRPETRTRGVDRASDGRSPLPPELPRDRHLYVVGDGPELLSSRGDHVEIRQLAEDFARYPYLPRLAEPAVLMAAIRDGLSLLTWRQDSFAYADAYDEAAGRYRGLRCGQLVTIAEVGLLVKPELALRQQEKEAPPPGPESADERRGEPDRDRGPQPPLEERVPRRFHGTVALAEGRAGLEASRIAEEVLSHLVGLVGAKVSVTLEIDAEVPDGVPKNVVRVVIENCRTLKFKNYSFEGE